MGVGGALMLVKGVKEAVILRLKVFICQENVVPLYAIRKGQNRLERKKTAFSAIFGAEARVKPDGV